MRNTRELFEKIDNDLKGINIEHLFNSFEETLVELTNSSEKFRAEFFGSQKSETNQALDKMREALEEISRFPDHLFKMMEYNHSVRLSDLTDVNFKKIQVIPPDFSFPELKCDYDQFKRIAARLIKTLISNLNQWGINQRLFVTHLHKNYFDCHNMSNLRNIFSRINEILKIRDYTIKSLKNNNIQIE